MNQAEYHKVERRAKGLRITGNVLQALLWVGGLIAAFYYGGLFTFRPQNAADSSFAGSWNTLVLLSALEIFVPFFVFGLLLGILFRRIANNQESKAAMELAKERNAMRKH